MEITRLASIGWSRSRSRTLVAATCAHRCFSKADEAAVNAAAHTRKTFTEKPDLIYSHPLARFIACTPGIPATRPELPSGQRAVCAANPARKTGALDYFTRNTSATYTTACVNSPTLHVHLDLLPLACCFAAQLLPHPRRSALLRAFLDYDESEPASFPLAATQLQCPADFHSTIEFWRATAARTLH